MFAFTNNQKLKRRKEFTLNELRKDVEFIEKFRNSALHYDEKAGRKELGRLNVKKREAGITEDEQLMIETLTDLIAESVSVKNEWEQSLKLIREHQQYLTLL